MKINAFDFNINTNGFIFHEFNGNNNYLISDLKTIPSSDFGYYFTEKAHHISSKEAYLKTFETIFDLFNSKKINKIILSRIECTKNNRAPLDIFNDLNLNYENTFNYCVSIEGEGVWLGATPEKLLEINQNKLQTVSIAGTKVNDTVNWGEKEIEEQAIVSNFIEATLKKNKCENIQTLGPNTLNTGAVSHLVTSFTADIPTENIVPIIKDLHPTPATSGFPKEKSIEYIKTIENHNRLFYTGFLGLINKNNIKLYVNLRCMSLTKDKAYLFLGGGITKESIPEDEWQETIDKSKTLNQFLV